MQLPGELGSIVWDMDSGPKQVTNAKVRLEAQNECRQMGPIIVEILGQIGIVQITFMLAVYYLYINYASDKADFSSNCGHYQNITSSSSDSGGFYAAPEIRESIQLACQSELIVSQSESFNS